MGGSGGNYESVACDNRNPSRPVFYLTNDSERGELRQYKPRKVVQRDTDKWSVLSTPGDTTYLVLDPSKKTFSWTTNKEKGKLSAKNHFRNVEGIDFRAGNLYFVSKKLEKLFILDLDRKRYNVESIRGGKFDGAPDQLQRILGSSTKSENSLLYFTEEGGARAGIHARDKANNYFSIVEGKTWSKETTGLAFSPDGKYMIFAHQREGVVFMVWREDGRPFNGQSIDVKRHLAGGRRLRSSS